MKIGDHLYTMEDNRIVPFTIVEIEQKLVLESKLDKKRNIYRADIITYEKFICFRDHLTMDELLKTTRNSGIVSSVELKPEVCFRSIYKVIDELKKDYT